MKSKILTFLMLFVFLSNMTSADVNALVDQRRKSFLSPFHSNYSEQNIFTTVLPENNQTRTRRAEVVFFISLPFITISHFLVVGLVSWGQSGNLKNFKITPETGAFLGISSLLVTGAITAFDNYFYFRNKKEKEAKFNLSVSKKF